MSASPVESKTDVLLDSLRRFYAVPDRLRVLTDVLRNKTTISLRTLDWLCTNYAKKKNIVYVLPSGKTVNVHLEYKSCLKAFSKKSFDPFQRRDRISITDADGHQMTSTAGQLNFFRFAINTGVIEYALHHATEIETDMLYAIKNRHELKRCGGKETSAAAKRKELSRGALKSATATNIQVTVRFT
jgi:hypothetical protein